MKQAPFDINYDSVLIRISSIAITDTSWPMKSDEIIRGTPKSLLWVHHSEKTNLLGDGSITANITLIIRNQSDYSNVIIILATGTIKPRYPDITYERMLFLFSEYLFSEAERYAKEKSLCGNDNNDFVMPGFGYTDDFFRKELDWKFE